MIVSNIVNIKLQLLIALLKMDSRLRGNDGKERLNE